MFLPWSLDIGTSTEHQRLRQIVNDDVGDLGQIWAENRLQQLVRLAMNWVFCSGVFVPALTMSSNTAIP